jgi:osmotically inducible protein OsmC
MAAFERQAAVTWAGSVREGEGQVRGGSGAFDLPVTFPSRVAEADGRTSPEEMIAAAHASCYAMALAATLGRAGVEVSGLRVSATVRADFSEAGLVIRASRLRVQAEGLTGLGDEEFLRLAREAEQRCPVSNALRGQLQIDLALS